MPSPAGRRGRLGRDVVKSFAREHERTYGHASLTDPISIVNLRADRGRPRPRGAATEPHAGRDPASGRPAALLRAATSASSRSRCRPRGPRPEPRSRPTPRRRVRRDHARPARASAASTSTAISSSTPWRPDERAGRHRPDPARAHQERARRDRRRDGDRAHALGLLDQHQDRDGMSSRAVRRAGRLIAQGLTLPLHLGSIPDAIAEVVRKFDGRISPGDQFLLNDPYQGGTHLPDFYLFKPIFVGDERVGWSVSIGHQTDVGGKTAGGNGSDATEIFQEGLRIPPVKLYERGEPNQAVFDVIEKNVRVPHVVLGDVRAQIAACLAGERGYLALIERYGVTDLAAASTSAARPVRASRPKRDHAPCPTGSTRSWTTSTRTASTRTRSRSRSPSPSPATGWSSTSRVGATGPGRDQLALPVHEVGGLRLRPAPHRRRPAQQRGLLPPDRGPRAGRDDRQSRSCRRRSRRAV